MTIKKLFIAVCTMLMFCTTTVFAHDITETEIQEYHSGYHYAPEQKEVPVRNGIVTFFVTKNSAMLGYDIVPQLSILLKENEKGILQNGDVLYFETSRQGDKYITNSDLRIEAKGVTVEEVKSERQQNCFAVRITRNDENREAFIRIDFDAELKGITENDKENLPIFSLYLNTDNTKQNNLFAKESEKNILLIDDFLEVWSTEKATEVIQQNRQYKLEVQFPNIVFYVGEKNIKWCDKIKQIQQPVYINQSGMAMLCFDDFIDIVNNLENIGVKIVFENNQYHLTAGRNQYDIDLEKLCIQNDKGEVFQNVIEKKDDVYYISLREFANLFGMGERIYWHRWDKTIHIK